MTKDETSGQKYLSQVAKTELITQSPQHDFENKVGGKAQPIKKGESALVKEFEAITAAVTFIALFCQSLAL